MNTLPQDVAVLSAELEAEDVLFAHTGACSGCTDMAVCGEAKRLYQHAEKLRRDALGHATGKAELDAVVSTAESIVRDILMYVAAGRVDDDARAAFRDWIVEAMLAQPTAHDIDELCRAAGCAGPVDANARRPTDSPMESRTWATVKARMDELPASQAV